MSGSQAKGSWPVYGAGAIAACCPILLRWALTPLCLPFANTIRDGLVTTFGFFVSVGSSKRSESKRTDSASPPLHALSRNPATPVGVVVVTVVDAVAVAVAVANHVKSCPPTPGIPAEPCTSLMGALPKCTRIIPAQTRLIKKQGTPQCD